MAGNHVLLRCQQADVLLGHFKTGSLKVAVGDLVTVGVGIAEVGNSGNTGEPHLHIHAQQAGTVSEPFSGNPLPIHLEGRFLVRSDCISIPWAAYFLHITQAQLKHDQPLRKHKP